MGNIQKIDAGIINQAFLNSTREYFVGNLARPQEMPYFESDKVEIGLTVYEDYTAEPIHYHSKATEYQYMISGRTQYMDVDTGEVFEFIGGDFYMIEPNTLYAQRSKPGTKILFIKIPSVDDKMVINVREMEPWMSEKLQTIRTDYYYDDCAPVPNSIRPAAAVAIIDNDKILMLKRGDSGKWTMPGGTQEYGESLTDCAVREVEEETGLQIEISDIVGTYTDPDIRIAYSDGEVRQEFTIVYFGKIISGTIHLDEESTEYHWVPLKTIGKLDLADSQRRRITDVINFYRTGKRHLY